MHHRICDILRTIINYQQYNVCMNIRHDTDAQHNVYTTLIAILLWPTIRRLVRLIRREIICIRDHLIDLKHENIIVSK